MASPWNSTTRHRDASTWSSVLMVFIRPCVHWSSGQNRKFATYLGYCAASFAVNGYPHRNEGVYVAYCCPGKQIARFPLHDGRTVFFVIFAGANIPAVAHHDADAQKKLLRRVLGDMGWECREIIEALENVDELYFNSVTQVRLSQWHRGRIALVGDAAFCPSLLAGEGSSLAMAGAYLLAGELRDAGGDFRAAYSSYQARFKPFIERKQRLAARFARQFAPKTSVGLLVRNAASRLLDAPWSAISWPKECLPTNSRCRTMVETSHPGRDRGRSGDAASTSISGASGREPIISVVSRGKPQNDNGTWYYSSIGAGSAAHGSLLPLGSPAINLRSPAYQCVAGELNFGKPHLTAPRRPIEPLSLRRYSAQLDGRSCKEDKTLRASFRTGGLI